MFLFVLVCTPFIFFCFLFFFFNDTATTEIYTLSLHDALPIWRGRVLFAGEDVTDRNTSYRIRRGMAIVPENRRLFAPMTVLENLQMGAYLTGGGTKDDFERVYSLFPLLHERRSQLAGTLSGGEQQMVAMGRALMARPKLLLMDEPSMGLAPILVERSFEIIKQVHESGVAMLIVEQNANVSLSIADRGYVLSTGRLVLEGKAADLREDEGLRRAYLGRWGRPKPPLASGPDRVLG